jgi:hypothetical protein
LTMNSLTSQNVFFKNQALVKSQKKLKKQEEDFQQLPQLIRSLERDFKITRYYLNALLSPNDEMWVIKPNVVKQIDVLEEQKTMYGWPNFSYKINAVGQPSPLK